MGDEAAGDADPPRRCAACGASLRATARFCDQCGAELAPLPAAGGEDMASAREAAAGGVEVSAARREPRTYTPAHLVERILRSRSALEGERKQLTVLFLDIRGSMELADQVDAEEWHRILDRFFQLVTEGVHAYEGTVNQYTGDGIMALFGAPIAHEDHAPRACHAALRIQETLRGYAAELRRRGLSLSVRIGLHSGEVVVGRIGDDLRMDYTAQGLTVGLAERMQRLAAPDQAFLTEATARLVEGFFELSDQGSFHLRGVRTPVRVFALGGRGAMRTRFDRARTQGLSRFVGRREEMGLLEEALERAMSGLGQVVGIVAPAGTGKSRLCHELVQSCRTRGIAVQEAHGVAHGRMVPLLPVVELLRGMFDVKDTDGPRTTRNKVAGDLLQLDRAFAPSLPLLFDLLGVTDASLPSPRVEAEIRERQLLSLIQRLLVRASEQRPQILVFEDLQWLDPTSETFLEAAVEAAMGTRMLVLVNYRPEYRPPWAAHPSYRELSLAPLDGHATAELVASWIGTDASVAGLVERIQEHAAGNPLFIEELIRELIETGRLVGERGAFHLTQPVLSLAVPSSVQTILAARIDRLDEAAKSLLATAAVIGKRVPEGLLREVAGLGALDYQRTLLTLLDSDFLCAADAGPEHECDFRHPLMQEVAYSSQLAERRRPLHAEVARALERRHAERIDEKAALLAYHWTQAGDALTAARWHGRAARWSGNSNQVAALEHWQAVRRCLATSAPQTAGSEVEVLGSRAVEPSAASEGVAAPAEPELQDTSLDDLGIEASIGALLVGLYAADDDFDHDEVFRDGCARAERLRDSRRLALLHAAYAGALFVYRSESFEEHAERALREAEATEDPALLLAVRARLYLFLLRMRGPHVVKPLIEAALATAPLDPLFGREHFSQSPRLRLLRDLGYAQLMSGRPRDARAVFAGAMDIARGHGNLADQLSIECGSVMIALFQSEVDEALATTRAVLRHAEFVGSRYWLRGAYSMLAAVHLERGELAQAAAAVDRAETFRHRWQPVTSAGTGVALEIWHRTGQSERAWREERANHPGEGLGALPHRTRRIVGARIAIEREGADARAEATRLLAEEEQRAHTTGARFRLPFVHVERAALARSLGDAASCLHELEQARALFVEMEAPRRAAQVVQMLRSVG